MLLLYQNTQFPPLYALLLTEFEMSRGHVKPWRKTKLAGDRENSGYYAQLVIVFSDKYTEFSQEWYKMHDAFEAVPILERLPLNIESIACFGKSVADLVLPPSIFVCVFFCVQTS